MKHLILLSLMILLTGCGGTSRPPVIVAPPPPISLPARQPPPEPRSLVDRYYEEAKAILLAKVPDAPITDPRSILTVHWMPTEGVNPVTHNPGFLAETAGAPNPDEFCRETTPDHHSCFGLLQGWTRANSFSLAVPFEIYALAENPSVVRHELLHVLYFLLDPRSQCEIETSAGPLRVFLFEMIEHGGSCDPLKR